MNLTNGQKFFRDSTLKLIDEIFNYYIKNNKISSNIKATREAILSKVADILLEYPINGDTMDLDTLERRKLYKEINEIITSKFKEEIKMEKDEVKRILKDVASETYLSQSYVGSFAINYHIKPISDKELNRIINTKIDGKLFTSRIWSNKSEVAGKVKGEIIDFLKGKTNVNKIATRINKRFDADYNVSKRLIQNEICRVQTASNDAWGKNHNIQWQLFSATLDFKTTEFCRAHDGKTYRIDDIDKPSPPENTHIGCRSCLINIIHKDWKPKKRLDNVTKERIDYKSYKEWEEKLKQKKK